MNSHLFLQYGLRDYEVENIHTHSSGSLASRIHASFDLISLDLPRGCPCFPFVRALHGIAEQLDVRFQFLTCVLNGFFVLLILGVDEIDST